MTICLCGSILQTVVVLHSVSLVAKAAHPLENSLSVIMAMLQLIVVRVASCRHCMYNVEN